MANKNFSSADIKFLKEALRLAKKGTGWVNPNPMVGAVVVKNGKIISKGYHKKFGGPHAEIEAFNASKSDIKGATLYVSLEPCCHLGKKTPPCTEAIIKAGIKKVVCATLDPNSQVSGQGLKKLQAFGIETVVIDELKESARELNAPFFTFFEKHRPYIVLKFAASLDGKIATAKGESKWITNEKARAYARDLRGQYQAVLVGVGTVLADDPHLGTRTKNKKDPTRIILDPKLSLPMNSQILRDKNILILTTILCDKKKKKYLQEKDFQVIVFSSKIITIKQMLSELTKRNITSVLVEGGSQTLGYFVENKIADKIYVFYAPIIIGSQNALGAIGGLGAQNLKDALRLLNITIKKIADNFLVTGTTNF